VPALGRSAPMIMRSSVVLPQPDWPMMPTTAPRAIARSISRSTQKIGSCGLPSRTRYRLVGVGLAGFIDPDSPHPQPELFAATIP